METLKNFVDWFGALTAPMRAWKYGEDGKYIHLLIGMIAVSLLLIIYVAFGLKTMNLVGISLYALAVGIAVERIQKLFGGTNTFWQSVFDASWVWVGGALVAYPFYLIGMIDLYYKV